jgi:hypothetical protein
MKTDGLACNCFARKVPKVSVYQENKRFNMKIGKYNRF